MTSTISCVGSKEMGMATDFATLMRHDACMDRRALERLGHHVVSRRVALGYRNRTDLAAACSSPCAPWPTSNTACARPAPAPTPCWKTSWPGPRQHRHHPGRGEPKSWWSSCAAPPTTRCPTLATDALTRASTEELLLELRRRIIARTRRHETWDDWAALTRKVTGLKRARSTATSGDATRKVTGA